MYPTIAATNHSTNSSATTSHTASLPASISAGDLLVVFFNTDGSTTTTPAGWTLLKRVSSLNNNVDVFYKNAAGSEGASLAITTAASVRSVHLALRITDWGGTPQVSTGASGSSSTPNPDTVTPSYGNNNYLWLAAMVNANYGIASYPTGYSGAVSDGTTGITEAAVLSKQSTGSSENPDSFGLTGSGTWAALTIGIPYSYPSVTTQAVSSITSTTATGNGNITYVGVANPDIRGVVYGTTSLANPGDVDANSSGYGNKVEETGGSFSTGAFTESLTSLASSTVYYVRAYAHNSAGYFYGDEVSFVTTHTANSPVTSQTNPTLGEATVWRNRILYGIDQPNTTYTQNDDPGGIWMVGNAEPQLPLTNSLYFMVSSTSAAPYRPWGVRLGGMYADQTNTVKVGYQDTQATSTSAQYHIGTLDTVFTATDSDYAYYVTLPINCDTDAKKVFHSIRPTVTGKYSATMGVEIYYRLNVDSTSLYDNNVDSTWTLLRTVTTSTTNPTTPIRKTARNIQFKFVFVPASGFSPQLLDYTLVFEVLDQYR